jgi:hypothetical protein
MSDHRRSPSLEAPRRSGIEDSGAHELGTHPSSQPLPLHGSRCPLTHLSAASSDTDEHFSDAQSSQSASPIPSSPIPKTRVERVDDEPSYGEVPGTEAYNKRVEDAAPDEIAIVPDAEAMERKPSDGSVTPGGQPIPKTVVEESVDEPGSTTHNFHENLHEADAVPDFVRKPDGTGEVNPTPASLETTGEVTGTAAKTS